MTDRDAHLRAAYVCADAYMEAWDDGDVDRAVDRLKRLRTECERLQANLDKDGDG